MSAKIMGQVYDLDLPANEQSVLLAMADHSDHHGDNVFPSNGLLAWKLGSSEDTVRRLKTKLQKRGLLVLVSAEPGRSKRYRINISAGVLKQPFAGQPPAICYPPQFATPGTAVQGDPPQSFATPPPAKLCYPNHQSNHQVTNPPSGEPGKNPAFRLMQLWKRDFFAEFKVAYVDKPRDWQGAKKLLKAGTPEEIMSTVRASWKVKGRDFWNCENRSRDLADFCTCFNKITAELSKLTPANRPPQIAGPQQF